MKEWDYNDMKEWDYIIINKRMRLYNNKWKDETVIIDWRI